MARPRRPRMRLTRAQSELVTSHAYYASWLAGTYIATRPAIRHMADDLLGAANEALATCALAFDGARGVKFTTFCTERIRGSMADLLRSERGGRLRDKSAGPAVELKTKHLNAVDQRAPDEACAARQAIQRLALLPGVRGELMTALISGDDLTQAARRAGIKKSWASRLRDKIAAEADAA